MKRRSANAGLDPSDISSFLAKNGKLLMPFLQNQGLSSSSDEETSRASFKIQDSRFDVVLKQDLSDDYNDVTMQRTSGPKIEEIGIDLRERSSRKQNTFENLFKNIQKSNESTTNRNSRHAADNRVNRTAVVATAAGSNNTNHRRSLRKMKANKSTRTSAAAAPPNNNEQDEMLNISDLNLHSKRDCEVFGDSMTSSCSSSEMDIPLGLTLHRSYSGVSS